MLNKWQRNEITSLLNVHYGYISAWGNEQKIYYDGFVTAFNSLLMLEGKTLRRTEDGLHEIVEVRY